MFTVGEFSSIAQVSKRLLRYYDEIGLFIPANINQSNGRRFYSAAQMPTINRILALKDLGLSLEQIQQLVQDEVSPDDLEDMLLLKKAEIEQQLQDELHRIRRIESRLHAIREAEEDKPLNVVIKEMPVQPVLRTMLTATTFDSALNTMRNIRRRLPEGKRYGFCYVICHEENVTEDAMDLEIGCFVNEKRHAAVPIPEGLQLEYEELPAVSTLASSIVQGPFENLLLGYAQIGKWAEDNGYRVIGKPREVTLQLPKSPDADDLISEVRYPVERIAQG